MDLTLKIKKQKGDVLSVELNNDNTMKLLDSLPFKDKCKILGIISFKKSKLNKKTLKLIDVMLIPPDKIIAAKIPKIKLINVNDCH